MKKNSLPNILVIDSDELSLTALKAILSTADYRVHTASAPDAAISAASYCPIDLIICDTNVDGCHGTSIVGEIHKLPDRDDIPVMFSSHGQGPDIIRRRYDFGGAYHIKKPFDAKLLIDLVERALWMPALVQTHIARPHFKIGPGIVAGSSQMAGSSQFVTGTIKTGVSQ